MEILSKLSESSDEATAKAASEALEDPPDLDEFHKELVDAVSDIISKGLDESFKAFVNHYMEPTLEDSVKHVPGQFGDNVSRICTVKDSSGPWLQGVICYNLVLYIKAYGLENLKRCRVCAKFFDHKGKYAVYCSDPCKKKSHEKAPDKIG